MIDSLRIAIANADAAGFCRPADHPADRPWPPRIPEPYPRPTKTGENGESLKSFNGELAAAAFGEEYVLRLLDEQKHFRGDWFQLALLLRCHETPEEKRIRKSDVGGACACPFCRACRENEPDFRTETERELHFEGAILDGIHLEQTHLRRAHFEQAELRFAHFELANLMGAHFENAILPEANLEGASLMGAHFEQAELYRAHLEHAHLWVAHFEQAKLKGACLEQADLSGAHLESAELNHADLTGANLDRAIMDGADVHGATGIVFDSTRVLRLLIPGDAPDPWSELRREYTGPRFFVHMLLLVAFMVPYVARTLFLTWESHAVTRGESLVGQSEEHAKRLSEEIQRVVRSLIDSWRDIPRGPAVGPLLGYPDVPAISLTIFLIVYNLLRFQLTAGVSILRDAEERSQITPSRREYLGHDESDAHYTGIFQRAYWTGGGRAMRAWIRLLGRWLRTCWRSSRPGFFATLGLYRVHLVADKMKWIGYGIVLWNVSRWLFVTQVPLR